MHKMLTVLLMVYSLSMFGQTSKYPYPILFLHGLVSNDVTWNQAVTALGGNAKIFDVCLNHDGNTATSLLTSDVSVIGWRDSNTTPSPTRLYVMNFDNSKFTAPGHATHTLSNQAAIYKQGIALKAMIQAVLAIETTDKVILVGHSMGGLEAREYIQRGYNGLSTGRGINWVEQTSEDGHRIAKLVTLGTPHLGSNHAGGILSAILNGADEKSEACRDLRYSGSPSTTPYLFGGNESIYTWNPAAYTKDVNCNGTTLDNITALNSGTTFNASMPLPTNISYTWITSDFNNLGQDGLVELTRQWLHNGTAATPNCADSMLLNVNHIEEPNNVQAILRGIDVPSDFSFAYQILSGDVIRECMTFGSNWNPTDGDLYSFVAIKDGKLTLNLVNNNSGVDSLMIYQGVNLLQSYAVQSGSQLFTVNNVVIGNHYNILVQGTATSTTWQNPYQLSIINELPVELTSFTLTSAKEGIRLTWKTATEKNNKGFEVQKSADKNCFKVIGFVNGHGTSTFSHDYNFLDASANSSKVFYRLKQIDYDGSFEYSNVIESEPILASKFALSQNYPNPFNPTTVFRYSLPQKTQTRIALYNSLGVLIKILVDEVKETGDYQINLDLSNFASGVYFVTMEAGTFKQTRKLSFLK